MSSDNEYGFGHPDHPMHKEMISAIPATPSTSEKDKPMTTEDKVLIGVGIIGVAALIGGLAYFQYKMFKSHPKAYMGMSLGEDVLGALSR